MENLLGVLVGVGLSAVCGFRVFVPMLGISIAAHAGWLPLNSGFAWLGTYPALIAFAVATILEIAGYYIPIVDNFLDTLATPSAIVAGTIVTAAFIGDLSPFLKWTLAIIAGGGAAGAVQTSTVALRAAGQTAAPIISTPIVTTVETALSAIVTALAFIAPILCVIVVAGLCCLLFIIVKRFVGGLRALFRKNTRKLSCA